MAVSLAPRAGFVSAMSDPKPPMRARSDLIKDGDIIAIDAEKGTIDVELSDAELAERKKAFKPKPPGFKTGALARYAKNVGPARDGAVTTPGADQEVRCYADI